MPLLHEDRLFPSDPSARDIAKWLYESVRSLPIVSPHGHTQAAWFAQNQPFPNPAKLFVQPDHYIYRMLYSQGISLEELEIGAAEIKNPRKVWRTFAEHYYLFRGTPREYGWILRFRSCSGSTSACRPEMPTPSLTLSPKSCAPRNSCLAGSMNASTSKFWPPQIRPRTR